MTDSAIPSPILVMGVILSTLDDVKEGPLSSFYLPFMGKISLDTFNQLMSTLVKMGLCTIDNHYVRAVTPEPGSKGEQLLSIVRQIASGVSP